MPMRVLLASASFAGGGITSYAHELIDSYSDNHELSLIIGDDSFAPVTKGNVTVYKYDCSDISIENVRRIVELINNEIKPDILISSCAKAISLSLPYLNDSIKVISVSHSLKYIESDVAAFNFKYSDLVVALSKYNKNYLDRKFKIKDNKVKVVYNFVREYLNSDKLLKEKKNNKSISIVFPGGAAASKSPEIVVKILNRLVVSDTDFRFYWLGNTSAHLIKYVPFLPVKDIKDIVKKDDRVFFLGKVPRSDAQEIIARSDIFLSPSLREGCPISLIEAMRVGCIPIVADYCNANKEIVKDGENGFVVSHNDIDRFVSIIENVQKDKAQFYNIYESSIKTYQSRLSFDVWKDNMDEMIFKSNVFHEKRNSTFDVALFYKDVRKFKRMQRWDNIKFLIQEPLPLLFKLQFCKKY